MPFPEEGLCPGDIGAVTTAGVLVIAGRENSVVNLGGSKVSLERIEEALMSFGGIRDAAAFTYQNQLGINQLSRAVVWSENVERFCQARAAQSTWSALSLLLICRICLSNWKRFLAITSARSTTKA